MDSKSQVSQQEKIRSFYKDHFTYTGRIPGALALLIAIPCAILLTIPIDSLDHMRFLLIPLLHCISIPGFLLQPYLQVRYENQPGPQNQSIYEVLQYLPVSRKQLRMVLTEYIWKFLWKFSLIAVLLQTLSSCITKCFSLSGLLLILLITLVLPMGMGILIILHATKEKN